MSEEASVVVIDNGSGFTKAGFANQDYPTTVFPSVVSRPQWVHHPGVLVGGHMSRDDWFVGDEAVSKRWCCAYHYRYPVQHGLIQDWEYMEKMWQVTLDKELKIRSEQHPFLLTESTLNPKNKRERMTQIMFESFNVPSFYIAQQAVLALYSSGRSTGIVLDSGDGLTTTVPIYEGYSLKYGVRKMEFAGKQLTEYLGKLLIRYSLTTVHEKAIVRDIKEKLCYTAIDFENETKESKQSDIIERDYELPDGQSLKINEERFKCSEVMFKPCMLDMGKDGIHEMLYDSIMKCNQDLHREMFANIVLSGGNMTFKGMDGRLMKEMKKVAPNNMTIKIENGVKIYDLINGYLRECEKYVYPEITRVIYEKLNDPSHRDDKADHVIYDHLYNRKYQTWIGGAIMGSLSTFQELCIDKESYNECGPGIIHRKCF